MVSQGEAVAVEAGSRPLWFNPPVADDENRRRTLTRKRVVAEALTVIGADGVDALSMRGLASRLGVVPGALYRHLRNKEQLYDLVLDAVLAEVDCEVDHSLDWTEQVTVLAHRLRAVLEDHPGIAGLLKTRDPLGPHSLALAEALLAPLLPVISILTLTSEWGQRSVLVTFTQEPRRAGVVAAKVLAGMVLSLLGSAYAAAVAAGALALSDTLGRQVTWDCPRGTPSASSRSCW